MHRRCSGLIATGVCLSAALSGGTSVARDAHKDAAKADAAARGVENLEYREVLFYFFQDKYFDALTHLLVAQKRDELPDRSADAELLLGSLYLSYGEHLLAGQIFEHALQGSVDPRVRNRAWFFLAKIWHQRGYLDKSEAALARIDGKLPGSLEPQRRMLHAQLLMEQHHFDAARADLQKWQGTRDAWAGYAKYNLGVALVRLGRVDDGAKELEALGSADPEADPTLAALRDKANVALGYAWLQASRPLAAKPSLERVRLNGPYSNKALLGVGWADAASGQYRAALVPWMTLHRRSLLDSAVQESLLAVPYAFAKLGAEKQAADYYNRAISDFDKEIERIGTAIRSVDDGSLLEQLLAQPGVDGSGWYWRLDRIPQSDDTRYLYDLLSTNEFQEGLKDYRDLLYLSTTLNQWAASLTAFDDILDTRQRAYRQRLPVVDASLAKIDPDKMAQQRLELESRLMAIERNKDAVALGTTKQQAMWRKLESLEPALAKLGDGQLAAQLRDKQRFLKGVLLWNLERDYKARLWEEKKNLRQLDNQIKHAQQLHYAVKKARDGWPEQFAALTKRVGTLRPRVAALQTRVHEALDSQREFLRNLADGELHAEQARLDTYRVQARFALAALYDRAAARTDPEPQAAPSAKPVEAEGRR